jgi:hypothetical protein
VLIIEVSRFWGLHPPKFLIREWRTARGLQRTPTMRNSDPPTPAPKSVSEGGAHPPPHPPTKDATRPNVAQARAPFDRGSPEHKRPGRPPVYRPIGELDTKTAVIVREYELALACYNDAVKSKTLAIRREGAALRRMHGARRACVQAGIDIASLTQPEPPEITPQKISPIRSMTPVGIHKAACPTCDGKTFYPGMSWTCPTCTRLYNCPM